MMSAPIKPLPEQTGVYRFEVQNGQVWNKHKCGTDERTFLRACLAAGDEGRSIGL